MLTPAEFREIVSGRRRGVTGAAWRGALRLAEAPYAAAVAWRNRRYDRGRSEVRRVAVPVVSVGNITMGGVGKTPLVEWLARWFRERGVRVTLISRGYGAEAGSRNDEALELEQKLPDVPHVQNPDRVEAAELAIEEFQCQLILLDDAFQHRRIHRDLDIVVIDALEPFGFDHVFPRGMLREPLSGLRRADVIALSRADLISTEERFAIQARVDRYALNAVRVEMRHAPRMLLAADGREAPLETLAGAEVAAFCGIGNPQGFRSTLESCGCRITELREFPDHHAYTREDVESLTAWAAAHSSAAMVVCTHKDLVKIGETQLGPLPLWALTIGIEILGGQEALERRLTACVTAAESAPGSAD
jgi:tetraacyldisaccharide 4'-kinase